MHVRSVTTSDQIVTRDELGRPIDYGPWAAQVLRNDGAPILLTAEAVASAIDLPSYPHPLFEGGLRSDHVLRSRKGRHGVGAAAGRIAEGGPVIEGLRAWAFGLSVCLDNHGGTGKESADMTAAGTEHEVVPGSVVRLGGLLYVVGYDNGGEWLQLAPAIPPVACAPVVGSDRPTTVEDVVWTLMTGLNEIHRELSTEVVDEVVDGERVVDFNMKPVSADRGWLQYEFETASGVVFAVRVREMKRVRT